MDYANGWHAPKPRNARVSSLSVHTEKMRMNTSGMRVIEALRKLRPQPTYVECYLDEGYPWVRVWYADAVKPGDVLQVGKAIESASDGLTVLFHALRYESICYLLDDDSCARETDAELPAEQYGVELSEVARAWGMTDSPANSEGRRRPSRRNGPRST